MFLTEQVESMTTEPSPKYPKELQDAWSLIIARAWTDKDFLERLRENPLQTLQDEYPEVLNSTAFAKSFPLLAFPNNDLKPTDFNEAETYEQTEQAWFEYLKGKDSDEIRELYQNLASQLQEAEIGHYLGKEWALSCI